MTAKIGWRSLIILAALAAGRAALAEQNEKQLPPCTVDDCQSEEVEVNGVPPGTVTANPGSTPAQTSSNGNSSGGGGSSNGSSTSSGSKEASCKKKADQAKNRCDLKAQDDLKFCDNQATILATHWCGGAVAKVPYNSIPSSFQKTARAGNSYCKKAKDGSDPSEPACEQWVEGDYWTSQKTACVADVTKGEPVPSSVTGKSYSGIEKSVSAAMKGCSEAAADDEVKCSTDWAAARKACK